ncbi:CPBP family intramembrane metalloprotease [Pseudolysobacter antarcticus]|uniref:CPBP family intramembrane metalloprotease n=1 Tax=Pseudolysobacter antarcticus TaxID=2511995 RepID=A0A411HL58_9GAMM|nr:CPBP family glutamic-type intramembrane protease [Pseudolysobacter antarcticus]QBB71233.1 CPBP family intramembrane metalloprotease [Pseudolysobacter antarcticus]
MESLSKRPILGAITLGAFTAIATLALGLFLQYFLHRLLPERLWGTLAAREDLNQPAVLVFFTAVIFAPLFETILGQVIPIEIARRFGINRWVCVLISAAVFGGGHYLNGGLLHGLVTFFTGIMLAALYLMLRRNSPASSYVGVVTAHAVHNAILLYVLAAIFPSMA